MIDLDDTTNCPTPTECATCGRPDQLVLRTVSTPVGVRCLALCPTCTDQHALPRTSLPAAVRACLDHCAHLGITADDMAAALDDER